MCEQSNKVIRKDAPANHLQKDVIKQQYLNSTHQKKVEDFIDRIFQDHS